MKSDKPGFANQSPGLARALAVLVMLLAQVFPLCSNAVTSDAGKDIPHVSNKAKQDYLQYLYAGKNRAFAIAPGGAWAWHSDAASEYEAGQLALQSCRSYTKQKCVLYALNDRIVFDREQWSTLWGPYLESNAAARAEQGAAVGQRFFDLSWKNKKGQKASISGLQGKLVLLHFWGSWCPPCLREFPSLKKLSAEIKRQYSSDIEMVMLQLREPFDESRIWVEQYGFSDLPLYDSGVKDSETTTLNLSDGRSIPDRSIARVFPSTYVLDRNGIVLFSHHGPVDDWLEYLPFIEHAVKGTVENQ